MKFTLHDPYPKVYSDMISKTFLSAVRERLSPAPPSLGPRMPMGDDSRGIILPVDIMEFHGNKYIFIGPLHRSRRLKIYDYKILSPWIFRYSQKIIIIAKPLVLLLYYHYNSYLFLPFLLPPISSPLLSKLLPYLSCCVTALSLGLLLPYLSCYVTALSLGLYRYCYNLLDYFKGARGSAQMLPKAHRHYLHYTKPHEYFYV